jgi:hypothetical protein
MESQLPEQVAVETIPEDESPQPISIRKLDRLETTYLSQGASN